MTAADIDAVYAMELEVFDDAPWPRDWFDEGVNDPDGYYFLAYSDSILVGYCGMYNVTSKTPNYCKIAKLAVKQDFRRRGIGNLLMHKMLDTAEQLGLDTVKLEVSTKNGAVKLYRSLGFKIEETIENYYEKSGEDAYIMWRF